MQIVYALEPDLSAQEFLRDVLVASTLAERRPVAHLKRRLERMLRHADIIVNLGTRR